MLILSILVIVFLLYLYAFVLPLFKGAVYYPSKNTAIDEIVNICQQYPKSKIVDLGSGDGRILTALARRGINSVGLEINPFLYLYSKYNIGLLGLNNWTTVKYKNYWNENLNEYDIVIIFGIPYIMTDLKLKLSKELPTDSIIISNLFEFPICRVEKRIDTLSIYKIDELKKK
jgi:16S rRNA A1518/A1519 N6-dimethyltransferase RsmA/KsgA/DIM1 with predicted DNA glycosylase/AP lyase activity